MYQPAEDAEIKTSSAQDLLLSSPVASSLISDMNGKLVTTSRTVKIESMDNDDEPEDGGGGDDRAVGGGSSSEPEPIIDDSSWIDKAPVPCNFCGFSIIGCSKFWAIFNLVQLFICWIQVIVKSTISFNSYKPDDHLKTCTDGGTPGAQAMRIAMQVIFMLVYTGGSILFAVASFATKKTLHLRQFFSTIYLGSCLAFFLTFLVPMFFHLFVGACYYPEAFIVWAMLITSQVIVIAVLYFAWKIVILFKKHLRLMESDADDAKQDTPIPVTPHPSLENIEQDKE